MRIGIVADDLTGAADAVAPFAMRGLSAAVTVASPFWHSADRTVDALAITFETRDDQESKATLLASRVRRATRRCVEFGAEVIYKKIDSTLRGYLRMELDGMRQELKGRMAIICPAFPANQRTVIQGTLRVRNVSQGMRVREAFGYAESMAREITLKEIAQGVDALAAILERLEASGVEAVFCDANTQNDLEVLAQAIMRQPERYLPVGSAGLSGAIAAQMQGKYDNATVLAALVSRFRTGKVLIAVGSQNPVSQQQAEVLIQRAHIVPRQQIKEGVDQLFANQRVALIYTSREGWQTSDSIIELGKAHVTLSNFCMAATGGATAMTLMMYFYNCIGLRIYGESEPGIVYGRIYGCGDLREELNGVPLMLKAGGFGDDETLARCVGLA